MKRFIVFVGMLLCAGVIFATELQDALKEAATQFSSSLRAKSVVAIIGVYSGNAELSDFMMDELTLQFIKLRKITVADRANLEAIKKEMNFQLSGEVGDETMQQLGAKVGAETVIQGVLKQYGGIYTLTIRALNVKTAAISDMYRMNVELGQIESNILGIKYKKSGRKSVKVGKSKSINVHMVGFQNMLFGLGSYMQGHYGDGAFLSVTHGLAWIFLFTGLALLDAPSNNDIRAGLTLVSLFPFIELIAIIYGAVRPAYYDDRPSILAYGNKSGFKFDIVKTVKGNIAPQISYVYRY
ncbi:MAG: hypothetical protein ACTTKH_08120 [Treponema sp.]